MRAEVSHPSAMELRKDRAPIFTIPDAQMLGTWSAHFQWLSSLFNQARLFSSGYRL